MNLFPVGHPRNSLASGISTARAAEPRSSASHRRVGPNDATGFAAALKDAQSTAHIVRRGDTLSEIVQRRLRDAGVPAAGPELYARVSQVARANGISDPDVISVGQSLDLSVLDGRGGAHEYFNTRSRPSIDNGTPANAPASLHHIVPGYKRISSEFGPRHDPFDGTVDHHQGIDIAARRGTPIFPAQEGTVVFAGWHGGHGRTVILRHPDGTETLYAHADKLSVTAGQRVTKHDEIGLVGSTGRSTGPHLHFELRRQGLAIDPVAALR